MNQERLEYLKRGFDSWCTKDFENALKFYEKALKIDPMDIVTMCDKAQCMQLLGRDTEAIQVYDEIVRLDPDVFPTYFDTLNELDYFLQISGWKSIHLPITGWIDLPQILTRKMKSLRKVGKKFEIEECNEMINESKIRRKKSLNCFRVN